MQIFYIKRNFPSTLLHYKKENCLDCDENMRIDKRK